MNELSLHMLSLKDQVFQPSARQILWTLQTQNTNWPETINLLLDGGRMSPFQVKYGGSSFIY